MKCESALEGWKIRKRIESGAYLGRKVSVAESLTARSKTQKPEIGRSDRGPTKRSRVSASFRPSPGSSGCRPIRRAAAASQHRRGGPPLASPRLGRSARTLFQRKDCLVRRAVRQSNAAFVTGAYWSNSLQRDRVQKVPWKPDTLANREFFRRDLRGGRLRHSTTFEQTAKKHLFSGSKTADFPTLRFRHLPT